MQVLVHTIVGAFFLLPDGPQFRTLMAGHHGVWKMKAMFFKKNFCANSISQKYSTRLVQVWFKRFPQVKLFFGKDNIHMSMGKSYTGPPIEYHKFKYS